MEGVSICICVQGALPRETWGVAIFQHFSRAKERDMFFYKPENSLA
jgi:hypothetical protein